MTIKGFRGTTSGEMLLGHVQAFGSILGQCILVYPGYAQEVS